MAGTMLLGSGAVLRTVKAGQSDIDYSAVAPWAAAESSWADGGATLLARRRL